MKFDKYAILGFTIVPGSLLFAAGVLTGMVVNSFDTLSLILASIGIGLSLAIFFIQNNQSGRINELILKINKMNEEVHNVLSSKRQRIADLIMIRIVELERGHKHVTEVYPKYLDPKYPPKWKEIIYDQIFGWNDGLKNLDVKGCEEDVMYSTFSEPIPSLYRTLLENAYFLTVLEEKEENLKEAVDNITKIHEMIQPLKKELMKYTTPGYFD